MNINKNKSNKKLILIIILVIIIVAGIIIGYFWWQKSSNIADNSTTNNEITSTETNTENNTDSNNIQQNNGEEENTSPTNSNAHVVKPTITFADETNGMISIGSFFEQPASGECKLVLSKPGEIDIIKYETVRIEAQYICQFWDIAVPSSSGWTARLTNINDNNESAPEVQTVEIR